MQQEMQQSKTWTGDAALLCLNHLYNNTDDSNWHPSLILNPCFFLCRDRLSCWKYRPCDPAWSVAPDFASVQNKSSYEQWCGLFDSIIHHVTHFFTENVSLWLFLAVIAVQSLSQKQQQKKKTCKATFYRTNLSNRDTTLWSISAGETCTAEKSLWSSTVMRTRTKQDLSSPARCAALSRKYQFRSTPQTGGCV